MLSLRHLGFICSVALLVCFPWTVSAEVIHSYDTNILVMRDGTFTVTEQIQYDFEGASRHGIFRTIPLGHPQPATAWYKQRYIDITVASVDMDGTSVPYTTRTSGDALEIKIGDPNRLISGNHTYTLTYNVRGALFYTNGETELYWNATGNEWTIPIQSPQAQVQAASGIVAEASSCYIGMVGSREACVATSTSNSTTFIGRALLPGEGMTIAQALNSQAVSVLILERLPWVWIGLLGGILALILLAIGGYRTQTKHKIRGPIIAQYEPYKGVRPMYAGMLIDGVLNPRDITSAILYLAEQGFITIKKTARKILFVNISDYDISLVTTDKHVPGDFLPKILEIVFGFPFEFEKTVALSSMRWDFQKQRHNKIILSDLRKALTRDMVAQGYFEYVVPILWKRRTSKGYEAMNHLKGFKDFLRVTGKDRFKFHNAPEKNPQQFLEYLPYAVSFGVEKEWAEVFKDVTIPAPTWYTGSAAAGFSATDFVADMSAFSKSLSASSGASASSGGGSVGGGAGGGGGGSW